MHVKMEAISPSSSYRTVPDLNGGSESEGSTVGSRPSSPVEYETTTTTRQGTALVLEKPTLVSFVPTSEIQTAVSITRDRVVIDTILPPTATLARSTPRPAALQSAGAPLGKEERDTVLERHQTELYELLTKKFTPNYDPSGKIRDDVFTTLTQLTRFPDPPGLRTASGEEGCPCICCELGCDHPLEPQTDLETDRSESSKYLTQEAGQEELHSFLEMDKPRFGRPVRSLSLRALAGTSDRDADKRSGGFWTFGRSNRSSSQSDFSQSTQATSGSAQESLKPPRAANATAEVSRSRSLSDLVRRRRSKHIAATSTLPSRTISTNSKTNPREAVVLPARTSSQVELRIRAETPQETPQPPPRRSSKRYAIVSRKPVPPLHPTASQSDPALHAALARSGTTAYAIDRIVEEDEDDQTLSRRHSALMSSFDAHPEPWSQPLHTPSSTTHVGVAI